MALKITIGQYYPASSVVHSLDPRGKILAALVVILSVFFIQTPVQLIFGWLGAAVAVYLCHVPVGKVFAAVKPVMIMLSLLALFNLFVVHKGSVLFVAGPISITTGGVWAALLYSLRLVVATVAATLLLLTTTPTQLTDAFDAGLSPFNRFGIPGHELAMIFSLMLRFIPTIGDEANAILDAQTARGGALSEGSPIRRIRSLMAIIISLFASSLHHASDLSRALDARCYEGGEERSHWRPLVWAKRDTVALIVVGIFVSLLIAFGILNGIHL